MPEPLRIQHGQAQLVLVFQAVMLVAVVVLVTGVDTVLLHPAVDLVVDVIHPMAHLAHLELQILAAVAAVVLVVLMYQTEISQAVTVVQVL